MCIVIDNNAKGDFVALLKEDLKWMEELIVSRKLGLTWVKENRSLRKYIDEMADSRTRSRFTDFVTKLATRVGPGVLCLVDQQDIERAREYVSKWHLESNDGHIIILLVASGSRLVITNDQRLIKDIDVHCKNARCIRTDNKSPRGVAHNVPKDLIRRMQSKTDYWTCKIKRKKNEKSKGK